MHIDRTDDTVRVTLTAEEAEAVRDDLGQIWASKISTAGDQLHSLLESVTTGGEDEPAVEQPAEVCGKCRRPFDPADTRFDGHAWHKQTPYCRACVDCCHDSEIADHRCVICA
ncbi:hypothetical protein [Streptomyces sp. NPDC093591]|uniref:hypothetical protein n=1 Tax=Streptomyces sp. NPDC093591 TaxID=3366044 RepID=UPI0038094D8E